MRLTRALLSLQIAPRKAIYAGSFDPPSTGHLDIIKRSLSLCDCVVVGVAYNPKKTPSFSVPERLSLLTRAIDAVVKTEDRSRISVDT